MELETAFFVSNINQILKISKVNTPRKCLYFMLQIAVSASQGFAPDSLTGAFQLDLNVGFTPKSPYRLALPMTSGL
jgi:hypothetical protein